MDAISARISSLCWPSAGAPVRTRVGVRENFTAGPCSGTVEPSSMLGRLQAVALSEHVRITSGARL